MSLLVFIVLPFLVNGQSYRDSLLQFRENYKMSLLEGNAPLKPEDTGYVRFYEPDYSYRVKAQFVPVNDAKPFLMNVKYGTTRPAVREYGYVYFNLNGASLTLHIYRFLTRPEDNTDASIRLFIPFTDRTNYKETFLGGRYLDVSADELRNNNYVILDFNKCYNPHTAYKKGLPYIIPPAENSLHIDIKAGEKMFGHNPGY